MFPPWWADRFGQTPPLGHRLRQAFPTRWLRIHSLPGSQRYPEDAPELDVLLRRHATVAAEVIGPDAACLILTATYGERAAIGARSRLADFGAREFECFAAAPADPADEFAVDTSFWVSASRWDPEAERGALVAIAEDRLRAMWLGTSSGEVYAPYDGGADLILADPARRDALAFEYRDWLSARPDGL